LKGTIREIENNCTISLIQAKIDDENLYVSSRLPKQEVARLNLKVGDPVEVFPIGQDTYFIVSKP
jgi:molybdopterin-binding protein